jgi:septal ring factor EnvC (AmiA/AmiB activator)
MNDAVSRRAILLVGLAATLSSGSAAARPIDKCDPRNEDFWDALSCSAEWERRIQRRVAVLAKLERKYDALLAQNASLRQQIDHERMTIDEIRGQIAEVNRELGHLRARIAAQESQEQLLGTLRAEADNIVALLDGALRVRIGCSSPEIEARRQEAKEARQRSIEVRSEIDAALEFLGLGVDIAAVLLPAGRLKWILEQLGLAAGIVQALVWLVGPLLEPSAAKASEVPRCD